MSSTPADGAKHTFVSKSQFLADHWAKAAEQQKNYLATWHASQEFVAPEACDKAAADLYRDTMKKVAEGAKPLSLDNGNDAGSKNSLPTGMDIDGDTLKPWHRELVGTTSDSLELWQLKILDKRNVVSRVFNLTPHIIRFMKPMPAVPVSAFDPKELVICEFPSQGELTMNETQLVEPEHDMVLYDPSSNDKGIDIPIEGARGFVSLNESCPGYAFLTQYNGPAAAFIVSMPVGNFFVQNAHLIPAGCRIIGPNTSSKCYRVGGNPFGCWSFNLYATSSIKTHAPLDIDVDMYDIECYRS